MDGLKVLIVDDEPLARDRIRGLLEQEPDIAAIGECGNGVAAVAAILKEKPDVLFLDVQMPDLDGFGVVGVVGPEALPATVFVTAWDRYALQAFEVAALDYLLKPFEPERFQRALERCRAWLRRGGGPDERVSALLRHHAQTTSMQPQEQQRYPERLVIRSSGRVTFLRAEEVDWIESAGNYVCLHVGRESHLLRETMQHLEGRLDPDRFLRIHRTRMVNVERIREIQPYFHGDHVVILRDGTKLPMSRGFKERLNALLERVG